MKYLIIVVLVLAIVWKWRNASPGEIRRKHPSRPEKAQDIVACTRCGVHFPVSEAVPGRAGEYCNTCHRIEAEH